MDAKKAEKAKTAEEAMAKKDAKAKKAEEAKANEERRAAELVEKRKLAAVEQPQGSGKRLKQPNPRYQK